MPVVLAIVMTILPKERSNQPLAIKTSGHSKIRREKRQEYRRLGRQLRSIEQLLTSRLDPLTAEIQRIDQRFKAQKISNYDALYQKSQLKVRQEEMIVAAMEEKLNALQESNILTAEDINADVERIQRRRDEARQKREEYQGVLRELSDHADVFLDL